MGDACGPENGPVDKVHFHVRLSRRTLDATFGATVTNIDLAGLDDQTFEILYQVWLEHALLIFPYQHLGKEGQLKFSERFGELEYPMDLVTNLRPDGTPRVTDPDDEVVKILHGNEVWHCDSTYMPIQSKWPQAEDIGINRSVEIGLVSDARSGLEDLLAAYGPDGTDTSARDQWVSRLRTEKDSELPAFDAILADPPSPIHPFVLVHEVKRYLEEAGKPYGVAGGASDIESWARWAFRPSRMGQYIGCGYTGTLGSGFPYAMGMKLARPADNMVCLQGDLDFTYRAMDVDTCARYDLPVVSVIANDSTMGFIKREQEALYGPNRSYVTDLEFRNFENVCEALGGHGELVRETGEIRPALERAFASGKPAVINVVIERVPSPGLNWLYRDIDPRDGPLGSG